MVCLCSDCVRRGGGEVGEEAWREIIIIRRTRDEERTDDAGAGPRGFSDGEAVGEVPLGCPPHGDTWWNNGATTRLVSRAGLAGITGCHRVAPTRAVRRKAAATWPRQGCELQ